MHARLTAVSMQGCVTVSVCEFWGCCAQVIGQFPFFCCCMAPSLIRRC